MDGHPFPAALAACTLAACLAATLVAANRQRCQPDSDCAPPLSEDPPPTLEQQLAAALRDDGGSLGLPTSFVRDLLRDDGQVQSSSTVVLHRPYVAILAAALEQCLASGACKTQAILQFYGYIWADCLCLQGPGCRSCRTLSSPPSSWTPVQTVRGGSFWYRTSWRASWAVCCPVSAQRASPACLGSGQPRGRRTSCHVAAFLLLLFETKPFH